MAITPRSEEHDEIKYKYKQFRVYCWVLMRSKPNEHICVGDVLKSTHVRESPRFTCHVIFNVRVGDYHWHGECTLMTFPVSEPISLVLCCLSELEKMQWLLWIVSGDGLCAVQEGTCFAKPNFIGWPTRIIVNLTFNIWNIIFSNFCWRYYIP